jgi:hypothetical protein
MPPCPDVRLAFHGSLAFITPLTDVAQVWISAHLAGEESLCWGPSLVIEPRYLGPIVAGMADEGLVFAAE